MFKNKYFMINTLALLSGLTLAGCTIIHRPASSSDNQSTTTYQAAPQTRTTQTPGEYTKDAWITTKVKTALATNQQVPATGITVRTHNGVVQLSGFVNNTHEIQEAKRTALTVKGVRSVKTNLIIKSKPQQPVS